MSNTNFMKAFMILGDIGGTGKETLAEKVAYKQRIVWATMRSLSREWMPPQNWESLTDEVKMERLEKLQNAKI